MRAYHPAGGMTSGSVMEGILSLAEKHDPQSTREDFFGYRFHRADPPLDWGSTALVVSLNAQPTGEHYDPETFRLHTTGASKRLDYSILRQPWSGPDHLQVVLGDVVMNDRRGKTVEAFTFGGDARIDNDGAATRCTLTSPVPIIDLRDKHAEVLMLAEEAKALLARRQAAWEHDPEQYEERIAKADVEELFFAILKALEQNFSTIPPEYGSEARSFLTFLRKQIEQAPEYLDLAADPKLLETLV